jgi:hypothetical protein
MVRKLRKRDWAIIIILLFLLIITIVVGFFYIPECNSKDCFIKAMFNCKITNFESSAKNVTWQYGIRGTSDNFCIVSVKALNVQMEADVASKLEGQNMDCYIPKDVAGSFMPEAKLEYCHGILKEGLQDLIIEKMHLYILQNLGQFNINSTI